MKRTRSKCHSQVVFLFGRPVVTTIDQDCDIFSVPSPSLPRELQSVLDIQPCSQAQQTDYGSLSPVKYSTPSQGTRHSPRPCTPLNSGTNSRIYSPIGSVLLLCVYGLKIRKYGTGSAPVDAHHCHPPLLLARSPSISCSIKYCQSPISAPHTTSRTYQRS